MKKLIICGRIIMLFSCSFLAVLLDFSLFSQEYLFKTYDNNDGLNSPELTALFSDKRGLIWMGGVDGLTKFDGKKFTNYNRLNGISDSQINAIIEDQKGRLLVCTRKGISLFDGLRFKNYKILGIDKKKSKKHYYFKCIYQARNGKIYAGSTEGLFIYDFKLGSFVKDEIINWQINHIAESNTEEINFTTVKGLYLLVDGKIKKSSFEGCKSENFITIKFDSNGNKWIGTSRGIIKVNKKKIVKYFIENQAQNYILDILNTSEGKMIFSGQSSMLYILDNSKLKTFNLSEIIYNAEIKSIVEDYQGNIWLATSSGLVKMYKSPMNKFVINDNSIGTIASLTTDRNNTLYLGTLNGLYALKNSKLTHYKTSNILDDLFITSLSYFNKKLYIGTFSGKIFTVEKNKLKLLLDNDGNNDCVYSILQSSANEFWVCYGSKVSKITTFKSAKIKKVDYNISQQYTQSAYLDKKKNIWFANLSQLAVFKNGKFFNALKKNKLFDNYVSIVQDKNGVMWIGTYGHGILRIKNGKIKQLDLKDGLTNNFVSSTFYDPIQNTIWVGTMYGISKIDLDNKSNVKSIANFLNQPNLKNYGCVQNAVTKLADGRILFSVGEELYSFNYNLQNNQKKKLKISLDGIKVNGSIFNSIGDKVNAIDKWSNIPLSPNFNFNQNNLEFFFKTIDFNDAHSLKYSWKLKGYDTKWKTQSDYNFATYTNLPSGNYTLFVKSLNQSGQTSSMLKYSFLILKPYYFTWWFVCISITLIILSFFLYFRFRIAKIKKAESIKSKSYKKLAEAELKAIRAQLNPHFIFNSLNAIQDVVLSRDDKTSRIYLADFARMMRMILENSTQKEISLEKEIEFLKLYLNFEKIRFEQKFEYQLIISDKIDLFSLNIPAMLIQPFIENAINHGLLHKKEKGVLLVCFALDENNSQLICTIEDNGIGRKESAKLNQWKKKKHESFASNITDERIEILNSIIGFQKFKLIISDLEENNENKKSIGTKVEIIIALKENK
jgi:ligand-binding sensor domain-containing protein